MRAGGEVGFETPITIEGDTLVGPARAPAQMLAEQEYGGHASVHDDDTAATLGLAGAPIEGPTHFSQFDPLAVELWGRRWFEAGCLSAHFQTMVVEGERVVASMTRSGPSSTRISATKTDGTPVLTGTATLGTDVPTELDERLERAQGDPGDLHIVDQLSIGMTGGDPVATSIAPDEHNGSLYPFSLLQKLARITEPCSWYRPDGVSPWGRPILPTEMISVLAHKEGGGFPVRGPSVGLFVDLEVRYVDGPVFVGDRYLVDHEVVGLGQSRRVESYWTRSRIIDAASGRHAASVLLHQGVFKESYAGYPRSTG